MTQRSRLQSTAPHQPRVCNGQQKYIAALVPVRKFLIVLSKRHEDRAVAPVHSATAVLEESKTHKHTQSYSRVLVSQILCNPENLLVPARDADPPWYGWSGSLVNMAQRYL